MHKILLAAAVAVSSIGQSGYAAPFLNVEFGPGNSATESGFTNVTAAGGPVVTSAGNVTVALTNAPTGSQRDRGVLSDSGAFTYADLYDDFVRSDGGNTLTVALSGAGILPGTSYVVTLYGFDPQGTGSATGSTVVSNVQGYKQTGGASFGTITYAVVNGNPGASAPTANEQYSITTTLNSGAGGLLSVDITPVSSTSGYTSAILNAIQVSQVTMVPEPTALGLLTVGGLAVLRRRRRQA
ncbi:MAG TPA: PEP-CTERM sorting domain-containing protein [Tepidisphaeraceae bacterium]|jgi:hypothetical protein|nr:PEP-CTERM sorting domain-containing protein [Tepidisphaeraceae bacterium]